MLSHRKVSSTISKSRLRQRRRKNKVRKIPPLEIPQVLVPTLRYIKKQEK